MVAGAPLNIEVFREVLGLHSFIQEHMLELCFQWEKQILNNRHISHMLFGDNLMEKISQGMALGSLWVRVPQI